MFATQEQIDQFIKAAYDRLVERGCSADKVEPIMQEALRKEAAFQGMTGEDELVRASAIDKVISSANVDILKAAEIVDAAIAMVSTQQ